MEEQILKNYKGEPLRFLPGDVIGNSRSRQIIRCTLHDAIIYSPIHRWEKLIVKNGALYYADGIFAAFLEYYN